MQPYESRDVMLNILEMKNWYDKEGFQIQGVK